MSCARCRTHPPSFLKARAPFCYQGPVREAIHRFKYDRQMPIGRWLAQAMAQLARRDLAQENLQGVVSVPMHWLKRRLKGFNPAEILAAHVAQELDLPYARLALRKTRWTRTQTSLSWRDRYRNVRHAFRAGPTRLPSEGTLLLVDDVLTSGATVRACIEALRGAGLKDIAVLTAASVLP